MKSWFCASLLALRLLRVHSTALDCMTCVEAKGSWQLQSCHSADLGDCPIADADCCTQVGCCVTSGCRSPEDMLAGSGDPSANAVSCHRCCEESSEGCRVRTYVDSAATYSEPYYNVEEVVPGKVCADVWPDPSTTCPACAYCDLRTEEEVMQTLRECNCDTANSDCIDPLSCKCDCNRQVQGLKRCPHLKKAIRSEL